MDESAYGLNYNILVCSRDNENATNCVSRISQGCRSGGGGALSPISLPCSYAVAQHVTHETNSAKGAWPNSP